MTISTIIAVKGREVIAATPDATLQEVAGLLSERRIGAVVVLQPDGTLAGILSERDIVRAVAAGGAAALGDPITRHMTARVETCREGDRISEVMERMTTGRFRHVPVIEGARVVAMISIGDVVKHRIAETEAESRSLRDYIQMAS